MFSVRMQRRILAEVKKATRQTKQTRNGFVVAAVKAQLAALGKAA